MHLSTTASLQLKLATDMSVKPTTKRKRDAAVDLRALAGEVNAGDRGRNSDLAAPGPDFLF